MTATTSVPANTGFVLVGTENKATLTIGEAADIEGNALIVLTLVSHLLRLHPKPTTSYLV